MTRPGIGILFNGVLGGFLAANPDAVDFVSVIPERFWHDSGRDTSPRFVPLPDEVAALDDLVTKYPIVAHGIGLSIGSASTFDIDHVRQLAAWHDRYRFKWISEHLAAVRVMRDTAVDHHAGLLVPLPWDYDVLQMLCERVESAQELLGTSLIFENGVVHTTVPETDLTEPEFMNALCARTGCGILLDLHNLHVNAVNLGVDPDQFLNALELDHVRELHIAGGNELYGTYLDSHSGPCPPEVWRLLECVVSRCPHLAGVTFEFHESYYPKLGFDGILAELAHARAIVDQHRENVPCHS
jgi:uncharacterized protein (UPF0276 family)